MGLDKHSLQALKGHLPKGRVISLGYPDITVDRRELASMFKISLESLKYMPSVYAMKVKKIHRVDGIDMVDSHSFFSAIGLELDVIDIKVRHGCEKIQDLNGPIHFSFLGQYNLVIDPGTMEHCMFPGVALCNIFKLTKKNGIIFHLNPLTNWTHGFWSPHPKLFANFYNGNGCRILSSGKKKKEHHFHIIKKETDSINPKMVYDVRGGLC